MKKEKKPSNSNAQSDNVSLMPKETAGERVKYLLRKNNMSQIQLARKLYGDNLKTTDSNYINFNLKLNDNRTITYKDAKDISEIFKVFPEFILDGGYENNNDIFRHKLLEERDWVIAIDTLINIAVKRNKCEESFYNGMNSFDSYTLLRKEIMDFIEFKVYRIAEEVKSNG